VSVKALLSRLDARANGRDRWRCACPVCGERNKSTLSIGIGDTGAVLLRCFKDGCSVEQIAQALGLELSDLFPPRPDAPGGGNGPVKRRRLISASQALDLLGTEMTLALVCASDMAEGKALDETTRERLLQGAARVSMLREEVHT
jgi:hypothetical protein